MIINSVLTEESIARAIAKLEEAKDAIEQGTGDFVDILCTEGEQVANSHYGRMATAWGHRDREEDGVVEGHIGVFAKDMDTAIIAEFGAGNATIAVDFENYPNVDVYPGAYSEQVGTGEYAETGKWHFGGKEYTAVFPRAGLLNARNHIMKHGDSIAREVIRI